MLMTYLGTAKSWLYAGIFRVWEPTPASIRVPMLLAGAASIWFFFRLLVRISGYPAALTGAALLATDSTYLLTTRCDWGPVALQHLLLVSGALLIVKYFERPAILSLSGGFFLFGLAFWDKALATWMLSGLGVAALTICPRKLWRGLGLRGSLIAAAAFAVGAAPVLIYNLGAEQSLPTFRGNTSFNPAELPPKARFLAQSVAGETLFGYWVRESVEGPDLKPATPLERGSAWLSRISGEPRRNLMFPAVLAAILLIPLLWRTPARPVLLFALIAGAVAWLQMGVTRNAGGGVHHTVLLWPLPQMIVAVAFAGVAGRFGRLGPRAVALAVALLCGSNLLLTNHYYAQLNRNGSAISWTDAIYPLSDCLKTMPAQDVFVLDWGLFDSLRLLNRGKLNLRVGDAFARDTLSEDDRKLAISMASPGNLLLGHTAGNEFDPRVPKQLAQWARDEGYRKEVLRTIPDRNGRLIFEVFRLMRVSEAQTSRTPAPVRGSRPAV